MRRTNSNWKNMIPKLKHIKLKDMDKLTVSYLRCHVERRKQELRKNKWASAHMCFNTNKWIVRANTDGTVTILAPARL